MSPKSLAQLFALRADHIATLGGDASAERAAARFAQALETLSEKKAVAALERLGARSGEVAGRDAALAHAAVAQWIAEAAVAKLPASKMATLRAISSFLCCNQAVPLDVLINEIREEVSGGTRAVAKAKKMQASTTRIDSDRWANVAKDRLMSAARAGGDIDLAAIDAPEVNAEMMKKLARALTGGAPKSKKDARDSIARWAKAEALHQKSAEKIRAHVEAATKER